MINHDIVYLINHVPIKSVEHALPMMMLSTELRPKLSSDCRVHRPSILAYQQLYFTLLALLEQTFDVIECLEWLFLSCEGEKTSNLN